MTSDRCDGVKYLSDLYVYKTVNKQCLCCHETLLNPCRIMSNNMNLQLAINLSPTCTTNPKRDKRVLDSTGKDKQGE